MVAKINNTKLKYKEQYITADYILNLYKVAKEIKNLKEKKSFIKDVKRLIPYIGKSVTLQLEED